MRALLLAATAVAALAASTAQAAQSLPEIMLGHWCSLGSDAIGEGVYERFFENEQGWTECKQGDGYLTIQRTGYSAHETECRFVSVRSTEQKWVVRVAARCTQEDTKYKATFEIMYYKGRLTISRKGS